MFSPYPRVISELISILAEGLEMSLTSMSLKIVELRESLDTAVTFRVKFVGTAQETSIVLPE